MAIIKCKMCGGDLNIIEGASTAQCEYCGSVQTVPKVDDEKKLTLFARANRLRAACEFDKAAGIYEAIIADFPEEAEAYWGLVLCKYGIEYVDDPATGKKIPTCHRSSFDSIMEDNDLEQALENADTTAQKVYREEAKQFERIRKGILEVSSTEKPYDIFICYKETDEKGDRTLDSVLAQDLYSALTDKGYRVFFSRITLQGKLGEAYEPYIFAALNSAKVMLAVGTCYEYYNAVWVKNEWSRYLKICAADKSKHLIPCYKDLDPEDMPKEFNHLQGADLGKMGAVQDILFNMEKYIPLKKETTTVIQKETVVASSNNPTVESYLKRAFIFLEDEDWDSADEYCEKVLDIDPECAEAYVGKLMVELQIKQQDALKDQEEPFDDMSNYQKAVRFADDNLKATLIGYIECINTREEEACRKCEEEERKLAEKYSEERRNARQKLQVENLLCAGVTHTVGLKTDGTVITTGCSEDSRSNVSEWRDIIAVSAGRDFSIGLKSNGTVVKKGDTGTHGCNVSGWTDIVAISAGDAHAVGLKVDGTVVADGCNSSGQCDVAEWRNIIAVSAGCRHTIGLKANGTVVASGDLGNSLYNNSQYEIFRWQDIIAVSAGLFNTIGLKADGTVVAAGSNLMGKCNVDDWRDVVAVSAGFDHTVGLKADGTVVATKYIDTPVSSYAGQCNVSGWRNIVAISAGGWHTVGLKADGTVVATVYMGDRRFAKGQCDVEGWRLFKNMNDLQSESETARIDRKNLDEKEREEKRLACQYRDAGKCQHCGGELKGFLFKKCVACGRSKDY